MTGSNHRSVSADSVGGEQDSALRRPPGPSLLSFVGLVARHSRSPYELLPEIARRYGDVVDLPVPLPGWTATLVSHPEHVDHVMTRYPHRYIKFRAAQEVAGGEPVAFSLREGEEWKRVRRQVNPYFSEKAVAQAAPRIVEAIADRVDRWADRRGEWLDLEHELGAVVMELSICAITSETLANEDLNAVVEGVADYGKYMTGRMMMHRVPRWVPRPNQKRGEAAKSQMMAMLDRWIAQRVERGPRDPADPLDVVLGMEFPGNEQEKYARRRSEVSSLIFAGFETTATALAWSLGLLCRHPEMLGRAYAEVDELGGAPIEYGHMKRLPFLRTCFDEAQRLQSIPFNGRTAIDDDEIGGYFIPRGSHVLISPYGLHRDPRFWKRPEVFNPDRFSTDKINRNAFIPFNVGPRKCIGFRTAYVEGILTLAIILQKYTLQVREDWYPQHQIRVSTTLVGGLPARVERR